MLNTIFNNFSNDSDSGEREEILHWFSSIIWTVELQSHWFWAFAISQIGYWYFIKFTMKISELTRMDEAKKGEDKQKHSSYESVLTCNLKEHYTGLFSDLIPSVRPQDICSSSHTEGSFHLHQSPKIKL